MNIVDIGYRIAMAGQQSSSAAVSAAVVQSNAYKQASHPTVQRAIVTSYTYVTKFSRFI